MLIPARQPKSVLKALRGIPRLGFSFALQEQEVLASKTARNQLGAAEMSETATDYGQKKRNSVLHRSHFMEMLQNE